MTECDGAAVGQIAHAQNVDDSAAFNQRHHRFLQTQTFGFEFLVSRCRSDMMRLAKNHAHFRKRPRDNEPVPTLHPPAARVFHVGWDDSRARSLGKENNPGTKFVGRTSRTVGRDDDVATRCKNFTELKNGARAQTRTGTSDNVESETRDCVSEQISIAAGANQSGAVPLRKEAPQNEREDKEPIVPECADEIFADGRADNAGAIVDFEAQRPRPNLQQVKPKRDEPARGPTLNFQLGFPEVFESGQRYAR